MAKEWAKAFYKSNGWQQARAMALRRDMYTCKKCGARAQEVHHIIELTQNNIADPNISLNLDNLMSLCHDCHTVITKKNNKHDCDPEYFFDDNGNLQRTLPG